MANIQHASSRAYSPEMDEQAHEKTYEGFVRFVEIGAAFVICIVLGLAVGGIKDAWMSALFGIGLAHVTTAIGLFAPKIAWRATAAVAGLLVLMLILY